MSDLPTPTPPVHPETELFWEATADGRLLLRRCGGCEKYHHYPRARCPHCFDDDVEWVEASGEGTMYTYTVVRHHRGSTYGDATPYVLAYVELVEGPRLLTHVVGADPESLEIGTDVSVVFDDAEEYSVPRFEPTNE